jgi:hypothetical protein
LPLTDRPQSLFEERSPSSESFPARLSCADARGAGTSGLARVDDITVLTVTPNRILVYGEPRLDLRQN